MGTTIGSRALIYLRADRLVEALAEIEEAMLVRRRNIEREPRNVWWRDGLMAESSTSPWHTLAKPMVTVSVIGW